MDFFQHPMLHLVFDMSTLWVAIAIIFTVATFYLAHFTDKAIWAFYTILSALASTIIALMLYSANLSQFHGYNAALVFIMITGSFAFIGLYVLVFLSKPRASTYQTEQSKFSKFLSNPI